MYRIAQIQTEGLKRLRGKNGIAFLDCDIPPLELINMINEAFTYGGILLDNSEFKEVLSFQHGGEVDLLLPFDNVKLDPAKIVIWQMTAYHDCHGVFFSDYIRNTLNDSEMELKCPSDTEQAQKPEGFSMTMGGMS